MHTQLIIADDNEVFRRGVIELLQVKGNGLTILGSATNGKETLELVKVQQPDVILMDVDMPIMDGIEATKTILKWFPDIKIIGWSMSSEKWVVGEMVDAGVKGYLLKETSLEELLLAIKIVVNGKNYYSSKIGPYVTSQ
jgi:DNA-binding NarL/FixJ family response regulator